MKAWRKLTVISTSVLLMIGLASAASPDSPAVAQSASKHCYSHGYKGADGRCQMTDAQALAAMKKIYVGPNQYTANGRGNITKFQHYTYYPCTGCRAMKFWALPPKGKGGYHVVNEGKRYAMREAMSADGAHTSWWNPNTWSWNRIVHVPGQDQCNSGAIDGLKQAVSAGVGAKLIFGRGASLVDHGPAGLAALAIGGCLYGIFSN